MKHSKKLLSLLLAVVLVFAFGAGVMAAGNGSITVENAVAGNTYTAYKIFDVTNSGSNYAYSISTENPFYDTVAEYAATENSGLTLTKSAGDATVYVVTIDKDKFNASEFAAALRNANITAGGIAMPIAEGKAEATGLDLGYYFVTSTVGTICNLTTTDPDALIYDKNVINFDKTDDDESVEVGQVVNYTVTGQVPDTTGFKTYTYEITDTMSEGLTFNKDVKVYVDGEELSDNFEVTYNENGYVLTIDVMNLQTQVTKEIKVEYTATVNENAVSKIEENTVVLKYSNDPTDESKFGTKKDNETVYTAKVVIDKYAKGSEDTKLAGAQFVLLNKDGKFYAYDAVNKDVSWVAAQEDATVVTTDDKGFGQFIGLEDGEYKLREIAAPEGYNLLAEDVTVTIDGKDAAEAGLSSLTVTQSVENNSGAELPSTGGMGTTLFYVFGAVLVLGAAVILVVRRRMQAEK